MGVGKISACPIALSPDSPPVPSGPCVSVGSPRVNAANADTAASSADKIPDSGALSVAPEFSDVPALVDSGAKHLRERRPPALGPRGPARGAAPVVADRRRIVQVLNNLLSNAARHAPESTPIRVAAGLENAHVAGSVSDDGSGVAPERLPHLFSKHTGAGPGATAGHGLGLAISNGLVEAHGGRIRAESLGAGCGTTVTFTMPVAGRPTLRSPTRRPRRQLRDRASRRASWWWTTTRGRWASSATPSRKPATPRW